MLIVSAASFVPAASVAYLLLADTVHARSQIAKGLASPQLRSGREKNSQATPGTYNHWSEEEDRELIVVSSVVPPLKLWPRPVRQRFGGSIVL